MVHAALFISPSSSCETARISVCNCMYISMSYHYSKYEFVGPESDLERYRQIQVSEFFDPIGMFRRNFPWAPKAISVET